MSSFTASPRPGDTLAASTIAMEADFSKPVIGVPVPVAVILESKCTSVDLKDGKFHVHEQAYRHVLSFREGDGDLLFGYNGGAERNIAAHEPAGRHTVDDRPPVTADLGAWPPSEKRPIGDARLRGRTAAVF